MRHGKCYASFLLASFAAMAMTSCKPGENDIDKDNNIVIRTPYTVLFGEKLGGLTKTNDGKLYKDLFQTDGVPIIAIGASGDSSIVMIKHSRSKGTGDLFLSSNNGRNFNFIINTVPSSANWASQILNDPGHGKLYVASTKSNSIEFSDDHGATWQMDTRISGTPNIQSFALTSDGKVYGLDPTGANVYMIDGPGPWVQVSVATGLPTGNSWYLTNMNNTLVAADYKGANGVYSSSDGGVTWTAYSGIPGNQEILSCAAPLNQVVMAGTDSTGIYRLVGTQFVPSNNGLQPFTSVYGITGKQDVYKNGVIKRYVYITTNYGLYRSEDLGQNWVLVKPGDDRAIW
jgi:hypothetical protein